MSKFSDDLFRAIHSRYPISRSSVYTPIVRANRRRLENIHGFLIAVPFGFPDHLTNAKDPHDTTLGRRKIINEHSLKRSVYLRRIAELDPFQGE